MCNFRQNTLIQDAQFHITVYKLQPYKTKASLSSVEVFHISHHNK